MLTLLEFIINLIKVWYKMHLVIEMLHKKPCSGTQEIVTRKICLSQKLQFVLQPYIKDNQINIDLNNDHKYLLHFLGIEDVLGTLDCYDLNCVNKPCTKGYKIVYKVYLD